MQVSYSGMLLSYKRFLYLLAIFVLILASAPIFSQEQGDSNAFAKRGSELHSIGKFQEAIAAFNQATTINPRNHSAWANASYSYSKMGDFDQAIYSIEKALEISTNHPSYLKALGAYSVSKAKQLQEKGDERGMIEMLLKGARAYPAVPKIWQTIFNYWTEKGEIKKIADEAPFIKSNLSRLERNAPQDVISDVLATAADAAFKHRDYETAKSLAIAAKRHGKDSRIENIEKQVDDILQKAADSKIRNLKDAIDAENFDFAESLLKELESTLSSSRYSELASYKISIKKGRHLNEVKKLESAGKLHEALDYIYEQIEPDYHTDEINAIKNSITERLEEAERIKTEKSRELLAKTNIRNEYIKRKFEAAAEESKSEANAITLYKNLITYYNSNIEILEAEFSDDPAFMSNKINSFEESLKRKAKKENQRNMLIARLKSLFNEKKYEEIMVASQELKTTYQDSEDMKLFANIYRAEAAAMLGQTATAEKLLEELRTAKPSEKKPKDNEPLHEELTKNYIDNLVAYLDYLIARAKGENIKASKLYAAGYKKWIQYATVNGATKGVTPEKGFRENLPKPSFMNIILFKHVLIAFIIVILILLGIPVAKQLKKHLRNTAGDRTIRKIEEIKQSGKFVENLSFIEKCLKDDNIKNNNSLKLCYAGAMLNNGNPEEAYKYINEYLKKDRRSPIAKKIAGEAALQIGDTSTAGLEAAKELLKFNETRTDVTAFIAKAYMKNNNDHKVAQEAIADYIVQNPNDTEALAYMADLINKRTLYTQNSAVMLEKAIRAFPQEPKYYKTLIDAHTAMGNREEAERWKNLANEQFPDFAAFKHTQQSSKPSSPFGGGGASNNFSYFQDLLSKGGNQPSQAAQDSDYNSSSAQPSNQNFGMPSLDSPPDPYAMPAADPYAAPSSDPYAMPAADPYAAPSSDPYAMPAADPYAAPSSDPYAMPAADPYAAPSFTQGLPSLPSLDFSQQPTTPSASTNSTPSVPALKTTSSSSAVKGKNCPKCGANNSVREYYCSSCGAPLM